MDNLCFSLSLNLMDKINFASFLTKFQIDILMRLFNLVDNMIKIIIFYKIQFYIYPKIVNKKSPYKELFSH